ncbi:MAG TPA: serpin family protein, partial [Polyangia bacterium]|jgi:serpin B
MMHQTTSAGYAETRDALVLELPYRGTAERDLAMVIVLPKAADGLAKVEQGLDAARLAGYVKALRQERVDITLPRFKLDAAFGVGDTLQALGMRLAFDRAQADFSGIMPRSEQLFISAVIHKAFVAVDEKGTEAAAATAVVMLAGAKAPTPGKTFRADHPFTFFLRDRRSGAILFIGRVADPA